MFVVLLAGGRGSRLSEETEFKPKPMIEIGGKPILWHIMMSYSAYGFFDFIICLGYRGYVIKEYFANFLRHETDIHVDLANSTITPLRAQPLPPWRIRLVDTGLETLTGGRLKRVAHLLDPHSPFLMTYGDGVCDVDIAKLVDFHQAQGREATLTAVRPGGRYGRIEIAQTAVKSFAEKATFHDEFINGGFFVLNPSVIDRIAGDATPWEGAPLQNLANEGQLSAFVHTGFWHAMDTPSDRLALEDLWRRGRAPWRIWDDGQTR